MSNELPSAREHVELDKKNAIIEYRKQKELAASPDSTISYGPSYYISLTKSRLACAALGLPQSLDGGAPFHPNWTSEDFQEVCDELGINYEGARDYVEKEIARRVETGAGKENN